MTQNYSCIYCIYWRSIEENSLGISVTGSCRCKDCFYHKLIISPIHYVKCRHFNHIPHHIKNCKKENLPVKIITRKIML